MYDDRNDLSITALADASGEYVARSSGHMDELTATDHSPADHSPEEVESMLAGLEEWYDDQATQQSDACAVEQMRRARAYARTAIGPAARVALSRQVRLADDDQVSYAWTCRLTGATPGASYCGEGASPTEAVDAAVADLDARELAERFGGYSVRGVLVLGAFHRPRAQARELARRFALDGEYLNSALAYGLPGVIDERPERPALALAA